MTSIGATDEFSLRVSIATLVRVIFPSKHNNLLLVLERKATFQEAEHHVAIKVQPFGGAVRINDLARLDELTGGFHFDSEQSRTEQDFRIFIRPSAWSEVKEFCLKQFQAAEEAVFETSPDRELAEEFFDALGVQINPDQYSCQPLWIVIENDPVRTANIHAANDSTARIYRVFEAQITNSVLQQSIKLNSERISDQDLRARATDDRNKGRKGRANACTILSFDDLRRTILSLSYKDQRLTFLFHGTWLEHNVLTLLEGIEGEQFEYLKL